MIKFIFCIISLIFWDPKQANKCFYCKTQDQFTGNSKVVDMQRNFNLSVYITYTFNEVVGIEINIYYNKLALSKKPSRRLKITDMMIRTAVKSFGFPSISLSVQNGLFSFNCLFLPFNTFYPLSLVSQPTKTQWPTRNKNKIPRIFLDW